MVPDSELEVAFTEVLALNTSAGLSVALKVVPIGISFTPGEDMDSLTPSDVPATTIAGGIAIAAAARTPTRDPATGDYVVSIPPPAGGFQEESGLSGSYPATIYGFVLVQTSGGTFTIPDDIIASKAFTTPITLTAGGQLIEYGSVDFRFSIGAWF